MSLQTLQKQRELFWETQPHYGGRREAWETLKVVHLLRSSAEENGQSLAREILKSIDLKVMDREGLCCYDASGFQYVIPKFAVVDPLLILPEKET